MSKLLKLNQQVRTCRLCRLCRTRLNGVPGEGNENSDFMFIGEGPGFNEDREGRPFVGQAGQFLEELLSVAGLKREDVYITNVVKCRPPQNRDPLPDEIDACAPYLERQMALINPLVVVTLGRYSMARFFPNDRITAVAGQARYVEGRMVVTMLHPAYALRNVDAKDQMRDAFRKLPQVAEQARQSRAKRAAAPEQPIDDSAFDAILEQHLSEIEQRLRETAPQPPPPAQPAAPANPFAYTAAVNSARKGRKSAAAATPKSAEPAPIESMPVAAAVAPAMIAATPGIEEAQAIEIAPLANNSEATANAPQASSEELPATADAPLSAVIRAEVVEAQEQSATEGAPLVPAIAAQASIVQEPLAAASEPVILAAAAEPKAPDKAPRRGRKPAVDETLLVTPAVSSTDAAPQITVDRQATDGEAQQAQAVVTTTPGAEAAALEPPLVEPGAELAAEEVVPDGEDAPPQEQAAAPTPPKGRKKSKPEPEAVQLSLF